MPRSLVAVALGLACFAFVLIPRSAHAAAGSLDPTFVKGGKVLTSFSHCGLGICNAEPASALLDSTGKIVVAVNSVFAGMVRYHSNGRLDSTFVTAGVAAAVT